MIIPPRWYFEDLSDGGTDEFGVPLAIREPVVLDDGSTIVLPARPDRFTADKLGYGPADFLRYVECYDFVAREWVRGSTVVHEDRELVCRYGDVYMVLGTYDWDEIGCVVFGGPPRPSGFRVVGRFEDQDDALLASIAASRLVHREALRAAQWLDPASKTWRPDAGRHLEFLRSGWSALVRVDDRYLAAVRRKWDQHPTLTLLELGTGEHAAIGQLVALAAAADALKGGHGEQFKTLARLGTSERDVSNVRWARPQPGQHHTEDDEDDHDEDDQKEEERDEDDEDDPLDDFGIPLSCWETYVVDGLEVDLPPTSLDDEVDVPGDYGLAELLAYFDVEFESHDVHDGPGPVTWEYHDYLCRRNRLYVIVHAVTRAATTPCSATSTTGRERNGHSPRTSAASRSPAMQAWSRPATTTRTTGS